ncbi:MAG: M48 family metalloprotease [Candidatus Berkiella sp.]
MAKGIWSPRLQKWLSLCGLVTTTLLPCLLISFLFSVPIWYGVSCQLAVFVVNTLFFLRKFSYPFNTQLESEQKLLNEPDLVSIFAEHAARAQIHDVTLLLDKVSNPRCDSLSWPYANSVSMSNGMLALYRKGFPKKTLAAIFSHELTHIKNEDSAARLVSWLCKSAITLESHLFLVSGLILGACLAGGFLLGFSFSGLMTLVLPLFCSTLGLQLLTQLNQLLYQKLTHALEFMADEGAVELTKDPLSAALMTFEIHFYSLGNTYHPMAKEYFKRLKDMAKSHNIPTGEIYRQTLHTEQTSDNLITHPLDNTRYQVIKDAYPEAFKNLPKIR